MKTAELQLFRFLNFVCNNLSIDSVAWVIVSASLTTIKSVYGYIGY